MSSSIEPSEILDGVPVLKPSYEQFKDFQKFIQLISKLGNESGIVKVVPPKEWIRQSLYSVGSLQSVKFGGFVRQRVAGCVDGVYLLEDEEEKEEEEDQSMYHNITQWKNLANSNSSSNYSGEDTTVRNSEVQRLSFLEQDYWGNLSKEGNSSSSIMGVYGIDTTTSLFPASLRSWNISRLPTNISDYLNTNSNNSSKLVAGLWMSTIPCTTQQPNDPCSISYIHLGAPKQWYAVPRIDSTLFGKFTRPRLLTTKTSTSTSALLETQKFVVSPATLEANGIRVNKVIQFPNEFILTFPCACYEAFDYGYNIAETAHFSSSVDDWTPRLPQGTSVGEIIPDINKSWDRESNSTYTPLPSLPNLFSNQSVSLRSTSPAFGQSSTPLGGGGTVGLNPTNPTSLNMYPTTDNTHNMGQSQQDFQQSSRVSSPLLSKMMDLSNIIEPTLDNSNLKFQTRRRYGSPKPLRLDDNPLDNTLRRPLSRSGMGPMVLPQKFGPTNSSVGAASTTTTVGSANNNNNNNNNNSNSNTTTAAVNGNFGSAANSASQTPTLVPLALRTCNVPSAALFDYNDDNLLALSLTSMANSSHSSPRPWKPALNSPIDNNTLNSIDSNRSYSASNVSRTNSNTGSNLPYRFTGPLDRRIGQGSLSTNNTNTINGSGGIGVNGVNRPSSPLMHIRSSDANSNPAYTLPFLKKVKSSNVVTLNVSRETSRSPVPMASTDPNQVPSAVTSGMSTAPTTGSVNQYSYISKFPQPDENKPLQSQSQMQQPSISEIGYSSPFDLGPLPVNKKPKLQTRVVSSPSALSVLAMTSSPLINEAELGPIPTSTDMRSLTNPFPLVGLKGVSAAPSQQQTGPHFHSPPSEMATLALRNSQLGQQQQQKQP